MGFDGISSFMIKGCSLIFVPLLVHIFNISLTRQIFPFPWKRSVVIPIKKKSSSPVVSNYRPITLLNFSKNFKLVIRNHLSHFCRNRLMLFNMDSENTVPP